MGVLVELNCETDFVAKTESFSELSHNLAMQIAATNPLALQREDIAQIMMQEYTTVLVNWSPENRNLEAMNYLGRPQRFGYPVFIILDGNGNVLHTQDTALLEEGRGYNKNHVLRFLKVWTYPAVNAKIKENK